MATTRKQKAGNSGSGMVPATTKRSAKKVKQAKKNARHAEKAALKKGDAGSDSDTESTTTNTTITDDQKSNAELERLQKELEAMKAENQTLSTQLQTVKKRKHGSGSQIPVTKDMVKKFTAVTKDVVWKIVKFLKSSEQIFDATGVVMSNIPELQKYMLLDDEEMVKKWQGKYAEAYGDIITKALNSHRSDRQQGLRTAYIERSKLGKKLPTPAELLQIVKRKNIDPVKNPDNYDLFLWYWEVLLTKVAGGSRWGHSQKYYGRISDHAPPDDAKNPYITVGDEAMVVLMWENCGQRFPYAVKCLKEGTKENKDAPEYQSKYSDSTCGQDKFGGWNAAGRIRFKELKRGIAKSKKLRAEAIKEIETKALKDLQEKHKINLDKKSGRKGRTVKDYEENSDCEVEFGDYVGGDSDAEDTDVEEFDGKFPAPPEKKAKA